MITNKIIALFFIVCFSLVLHASNTNQDNFIYCPNEFKTFDSSEPVAPPDPVRIDIQTFEIYANLQDDKVQHTIDRYDTDCKDFYQDNRREMQEESKHVESKEYHGEKPKNEKSENLEKDPETKENLDIDGLTDFEKLDQNRRTANLFQTPFHQTYNISQQSINLVRECDNDPTLLRSFAGTPLQHQLHTEFIEIIDKSADQYYKVQLPKNLREFHKALAEMAIIGIKQNQYARISKSTAIANFCWAALDYGKIVSHYIVTGVEITADYITNLSAHGQVLVNKLADLTEQFLLTDSARIIAPYFSARMQAANKVATYIAQNQAALVERKFTPQQKKEFVDNLYKEILNYESKCNAKQVEEFVKGLFEGSGTVLKNFAQSPLEYIISFLTAPLKPLIYGATRIVQYKAINSIAEHDSVKAFELLTELNKEVESDFNHLYEQVASINNLSTRDKGRLFGSLFTDLVIANKAVIPAMKTPIRMFNTVQHAGQDLKKLQQVREVLNSIKGVKPGYVKEILGIKIARFPNNIIVAGLETTSGTQAFAVLSAGNQNRADKLFAQLKQVDNSSKVTGALKSASSLAQIESKVLAASSSTNSGMHPQEILPEQPFNLVEAEKILAESTELKELNKIVETFSSKVIPERYDTRCSDIIDEKTFFKLEKLAIDGYEAIRSNFDDVNQISKNTSIPVDIIKAIKDHVFYSSHIIETSSGVEIARFYPNIDMADAWNRLTNNSFSKSDLLWLQHEFAESLIMRGDMIRWRYAHDFVNKIYNWQRETMV